MDRTQRMIAVRFLPGVPENVTPAKGAISADEGYIDRSHAYYVDRKINRDGKSSRSSPSAWK